MTLLITGATGQIGSELVPHLRAKYPDARIVVTALPHDPHLHPFGVDEVVERLDATNQSAVDQLINKEKPDTIYHLVGILSARGEQDPQLAWRTNMDSLKFILDAAVANKVSKVFWPSSIAAFGPTTPRELTPQQTVLAPTTMYGVTKVAGELLCQYYAKKYQLDVRSVRFPGIISYKTEPGGGTTDYAVDIFYQAIQHASYTCFVRPDTMLPMMYMDDAIRAVDLLMDAPAENITIRTSYNLTALHFTAAELAAEIAQRMPGFTCDYNPDFRQQIADSWPKSIDDRQARTDWQWAPEFTLTHMVDEMLQQLKRKLGAGTGASTS